MPIWILKFKWPPIGQFWSEGLLLLAQSQWRNFLLKWFCKLSYVNGAVTNRRWSLHLFLPKTKYVHWRQIMIKTRQQKKSSFPFYFLEPLQWMEVCNSVSESRLFCAKCGSKLGTYSWDAAIKCPCGASMAPGFFINLNRVDKCTMHKDIEAVI